MTMRTWLAADTDKLASGGLRLPSSFVLPLLPILVYSGVARGEGTLESWSLDQDVGDVQTSIGQLSSVQLLPSVWVLLILIAIAVAGHIVARGREDTKAAVSARVTSVIWMWVVTGAATFGGFAWLVIASAIGTDVGIPFPLMGTLTPLR